MRELALFALAFSLSCAAGSKQPHTASVSEVGGDRECVKRIAEVKKHYCEDHPSELGEGYAAQLREKYDGLDGACLGTRSRRSLRDLEECLVGFESTPSQIDDETKARREAAKARAADLRNDDVFKRTLQKKRSAIGEADGAADEFKAARTSGVEETELQFRKENWDVAEVAARAAQEELRAAIRKHDLDPRDARALGLW